MSKAKPILLAAAVVAAAAILIVAYRSRTIPVPQKSPFLVKTFENGTKSREAIVRGIDKCPLHEELTTTSRGARYSLRIESCADFDIAGTVRERTDQVVDLDKGNQAAIVLHKRIRNVANYDVDQIRAMKIGETRTDVSTYGTLHATISWTRVTDDHYTCNLVIEETRADPVHAD